MGRQWRDVGDVVACASVWAEPVVGGGDGAHGAAVAVDAVDAPGAARVAELCFAKAVLLASAAHRSDKTLEVFARDEGLLVDHARRLTVDQTAQMLQHWLLRADPDGGPGTGDGDRLHVSETFAGATALDGLYTSEDGPSRQGRSRRGVRATVAGRACVRWPHAHPRTTQGRRARRAARRAVGADPGRPTIAVTISVDDLEARTGSGRVDRPACPSHRSGCGACRVTPTWCES